MKMISLIIHTIDFILIIISIINLIIAYQQIDKANDNLEELIKAKEANCELRFENYEYEVIIKTIYKIVSEKGQGSIIDRFFKIKEVIKSANPNNF